MLGLQYFTFRCIVLLFGRFKEGHITVVSKCSVYSAVVVL